MYGHGLGMGLGDGNDGCCFGLVHYELLWINVLQLGCHVRTNRSMSRKRSKASKLIKYWIYNHDTYAKYCNKTYYQHEYDVLIFSFHIYYDSTRILLTFPICSVGVRCSVDLSYWGWRRIFRRWFLCMWVAIRLHARQT